MGESDIDVLKTIVMAASENKVNWFYAKDEYDVIGYCEDEDCSGVCTCGKRGLRYLYTIQNRYNKNVIYPLGSKCIEQFESDRMRRQQKIMHRGINIVRCGKYKGLTFDELMEQNYGYAYYIQHQVSRQWHHDYVEYFKWKIKQTQMFDNRLIGGSGKYKDNTYNEVYEWDRDNNDFEYVEFLESKGYNQRFVDYCNHRGREVANTDELGPERKL